MTASEKTDLIARAHALLPRRFLDCVDLLANRLAGQPMAVVGHVLAHFRKRIRPRVESELGLEWADKWIARALGELSTKGDVRAADYLVEMFLGRVESEAERERVLLVVPEAVASAVRDGLMRRDQARAAHIAQQAAESERQAREREEARAAERERLAGLEAQYEAAKARRGEVAFLLTLNDADAARVGEPGPLRKRHQRLNPRWVFRDEVLARLGCTDWELLRWEEDDRLPATGTAKRHVGRYWKVHRAWSERDVRRASGRVAMWMAADAGLPTDRRFVALVKACQRSKGDTLPPKVLADWLDENGRGEVATSLRFGLVGRHVGDLRRRERRFVNYLVGWATGQATGRPAPIGS